MSEYVTFEVPYLTPPSVNHHKKPIQYVKNGVLRRGMALTAEAKAFKDAVCIFARGGTVAPVTEKERRKVKYRVHVDVYLGPRMRLDADNAGKLLCDGLQKAGVIHSDAFVGEFLVRPHKDERENPRTVFHVWRM